MMPDPNALTAPAADDAQRRAGSGGWGGAGDLGGSADVSGTALGDLGTGLETAVGVTAEVAGGAAEVAGGLGACVVDVLGAILAGIFSG